MTEAEPLADQIRRMVSQRKEERDRVEQKEKAFQTGRAYVAANSQAESGRLIDTIRKEVAQLNEANTGLPPFTEVPSNGYAVTLGGVRASLEFLTSAPGGPPSGIVATVGGVSVPFMLAAESPSGPMTWHDEKRTWTAKQIAQYVLFKLSEAYLKKQP